MQTLSDKEQFELIRENLRLAAEDAMSISRDIPTGMHYISLRKHLLAAEEACRAIMWLREDARWSEFSLLFPKCVEISRRWLSPLSVEGKKVFYKMAESIGWLLAYAEDMRTRKTGIKGMILPQVGRVVTHVPEGSLRTMIAQGTA